MQIETTGRVVDGKIVVDGVPLEEGAIVTVIIGNDGGPTLTPEMEAELDAAIEEADRGEFVPWEEVLAEVRRIERGERS